MKNLFILFLLLITSTTCHGQLAGSDHDFSATNWSQGNICLPCHTSHNKRLIDGAAPLWNRDENTTAYQVYTSVSLDAAVGQPGGVSKLCLSCHDGITALDAFGGSVGSVLISGGARLGTDISDHHPVSFIYDAALAVRDGGLNDPLISPSGLGRTISQDLLFNNRVECVSCHDPHNRFNHLELIETGIGPDGLCSTCHRVPPPDLLDTAINFNSLR